MNHRTCPAALRVSLRTETCLEFTARLWLSTALVVWAGWLGLLGLLWVRV